MITVLAAACNGQDYLKEQMNSILDQTLEDVRILISDDCSSDGTPEILRSFETLYPQRVRAVYRKKPSGGAAAHFLWLLSRTARALEEGGDEDDPFVWAAKGDYFMLSDQDDVWLPHKALVLLTAMKKLEAQAPGPVLVHSDMEVTDQHLMKIAPSFFAYQKIDPSRNRLPQLLCENNVTGGAVMINRPLLMKMKKSPRVCLMHDAWLALTAACFGRIGWVEEPLYLYRQHGANTLGAQKSGSLRAAGKRLADGSAARENYRKMFGQARSMLEVFGQELGPKQREILSAFGAMEHQSRLGRIHTMIKYGFTKNGWLRTLGQMMFMGS